mgnify:CR=1 FL=1
MKRLSITFYFLMFLQFCYSQNLDGTYTTDFNEMTLQQSGNKVTGTYKYSNGVIEGTLNGKILTGTWTQSNGKGKFVFVFNNDFSAFSGKWGHNDAEPSSAWNGKKIIADIPNISGAYTTDFNEMTLQQSGNKVTGTYKYSNGVIEGTLNGKILTGTWTQSNGKGKFVFVFNNDFSAFSGKWGHNDAEPSSAWNGKKIIADIPNISGAYTTDFNEMTLQQSGNKVTGTYKYSNGVIEGTLNGKILTGTWTQSNGKGKLVFVFNNDFSAFSGKWGYNDAEPSSAWNGKKL